MQKNYINVEFKNIISNYKNLTDAIVIVIYDMLNIMNDLEN